MDIVTKPIEALTPADYNPRVALQPKDPRYRKLKRSLERFGLVEPLVWNRRSGRVVGGHQRLRVLADLGHTQVPVAVVDLDDDQEKALNIVLNNREAQSDWDLPRLTQLLDELAAAPVPQLSATGFDPSHVELMKLNLAPAPTPPVEAPPTHFEINLRVPLNQWPAVRADLDPIVARHELECHVRQR
jgi:hypothetical protein